MIELDDDDYCIKIKNFGDKYDDAWKQVLEYEGFNLEIEDGLWISGLGSFMKFDDTLYQGEGHEYDGSFGMKHYDSNKERWYVTINGYKVYPDIWVDMPSGKYLLAIRGFVRKEIIDTNVNKEAVNYGYQLELVRVDKFDGFKNPREDEYNFNIRSTIR